jgi:Leucine-rich repeat (LRR) protein
MESPLASLTHLYLGNNTIVSVEHQMFARVSALRVLSLSSCSFMLRATS